MTEDRERIIRYLVVFLLCLFLLFLVFGDQGLIHYYRLEKERAEIEEKLKRLEMENRLLAEEVERLQGDAQHLERVIRREMGFVKDNELLVIVPEDKHAQDKREK